MKWLKLSGNRSWSSLNGNCVWYIDPLSLKWMPLQKLSKTISLVALVSKISISQSLNFSWILSFLGLLMIHSFTNSELWSMAQNKLCFHSNKCFTFISNYFTFKNAPNKILSSQNVQIRSFFWSAFSRVPTEYAAKDGPEKSSYLDTFHVVKLTVGKLSLWILLSIARFFKCGNFPFAWEISWQV